MKKYALALIGILLISALALSACGGGGTPAPDAAATLPNGEPVATKSQPNEALATAKAQPTEKTPPSLQFTVLKGKVEIRKTANEQWTPAQKGLKLGVGTEIRTGSESRAILYRDRDTMISLENDSVLLVKKLAFEAKNPITILGIINGKAALEHNSKLPVGAVLRFETPDKQQAGAIHSIVRVSFNAVTHRLTAACFSGECNFVKDSQPLNLIEGQQVDDTAQSSGLPNVMAISSEQENEFLAQVHALCDCNQSFSEIINAGLISFIPAPNDVPTPEEDLEASVDENGNTDPATTEISDELFNTISDELINEIPNDPAAIDPAVTDPAVTDPAATDAPAP